MNKRITAGMGFVALTAVLLCGMAWITDRNHVETAYKLKLPVWKARFRSAGRTFPPAGLLIRIFKKEAVLEVWVQSKAGERYTLLKEYGITASSGVLGPKRKEGDRQVPEGFYRVQGLNPNSSYYLSIRLDYPNRSDRILADREHPGGDIFIHGKAVTIGCIPIGDDGIRELYVLVAEYRKKGRKPIPVHAFPTRLGGEAWTALRRTYAGRPGLLRFWADLKAGYDAFESTGIPPAIAVGADGRYLVRKG